MTEKIRHDVTGVDRRRRAQLEQAVAENLDALMTLDMRGYGVPRILYSSARKDYGEPLAMRSGKRLLALAESGRSVLIGSGFVFLPYEKGELDGLVGAVVLARALERARGALPVLVVEAELVQPTQTILREAGLNVVLDAESWQGHPHSAAVVAFTKDASVAADHARELIDTWRPTAVTTIEKPGRNSKGVYHMGNGADVTALAAKFDEVLVAAAARGIDTFAIGDLGNEIGLGGLRDTIHSRIPFGARCACPCEGGMAAEVAADNIIVATTSDWGSYALSASLAFLTGDISVAVDGHTLARLLDCATRNGLLDGSGYAIPSVDGITKADNARFADVLVAAVKYPTDAVARFGRMYDLTAELENPMLTSPSRRPRDHRE